MKKFALYILEDENIRCFQFRQHKSNNRIPKIRPLTHWPPDEKASGLFSKSKTKRVWESHERSRWVLTGFACCFSEDSGQKSEVWPQRICLLFQNSVGE